MIGQNIGKYQVLDRIGRGGMGTVYRAMDEFLHREVAIKVLNAELNEPAVARRFQAEAITVARLNHPGIATVYELFQNDGQWLMVMEFLRGETLEALVIRKGPLPLAEAAEIMMQGLSALAHAHSLGVVHRDLKPANLMAGAGGLVKVMDFGIARVAGTEHLTNAGLMMGTPAYMAPEQVLGEEIDARADIYAMGAVLFYLLTAELPFKGRSPFELAQARIQGRATPLGTVRSELPAWIGQVVEKALSRQPADRFQSAQAFHDALRRGLAGLPLDEPAADVPAVSTGAMATLPPGALRAAGHSAAESAEVPAELMETVLGAPAPVAPSGAPAAAAPDVMETVAVPSADVAPTMLAASPMAGRAARPPASGGEAAPDEAASPRSAAPAAGAVSSAPRSAAPAAAAASSASRTPIYAGIAVLVVVLAGAAMWMRGGPPDAPVQEAVSAEAGTPEADVAPAAAPDAGAPAADVESAAAAAAPTAVAGADDPAPASAPSPSAASGTPASSTTPGAGAPPPPASPGAGGSAAARSAAAAAPPASAAPVAFEDLRVLVVLGRKAEERSAVLRFADGLIAAVSDRDAAPIVSIPERELSYAAYARAKDPRWSVILAAPPPDTDFPGGLFRSSKHWLTLQSRSTFMILRLNDDDWRNVLNTVTARTGVQVDTSAGSR